jgi:hypothetical protein
VDQACTMDRLFALCLRTAKAGFKNFSKNSRRSLKILDATRVTQSKCTDDLYSKKFSCSSDLVPGIFEFMS